MDRPKKYLLDGEPIDFQSLIQAAVDSEMEHDGLLSTSAAAHFLRTRCNCTVEINPDCKD